MGLKTVFCNGKCEDCIIKKLIGWNVTECMARIKPKIVSDGWIDELDDDNEK